MRRNYERLEDVYGHVYDLEVAWQEWEATRSGILFQGDVWYQASWWGDAEEKHACGSAGCFAGWTNSLAGHRVTGEATSLVGIKADDIDIPTLFLERGNSGREVVITSALARRLLGLNSDEGDNLFHGANSMEQIRCIINEWRREDGLEPIPYEPLPNEVAR